MNCTEVLELLDPWLDGELPKSEAELVAQHVDGCSSCARERTELERLSKCIRDAGNICMPSTLEHDVRNAISGAAGAEKNRSSRISKFALTLSHCAAGVVGAVLGVLIWTLAPQHTTESTAFLVAAHTQGLMSSNGERIASSDRHIVRPWFAGRIDYAPPVKDLSAAGFPLLEGRVLTTHGRRQAALLYGVRNHRLTLVITPTAHRGSVEPVSETLRGYNVVRWSVDEFDYAAVSDVNKQELHGFANLITNSEP